MHLHLNFKIRKSRTKSTRTITVRESRKNSKTTRVMAKWQIHLKKMVRTEEQLTGGKRRAAGRKIKVATSSFLTLLSKCICFEFDFN